MELIGRPEQFEQLGASPTSEVSAASSNLSEFRITAIVTSSLIHSFGSIRYSHSNAINTGGSIHEDHSLRAEVLRKQVSQPSRHPSSLPEPSQRAISSCIMPSSSASARRCDLQIPWPFVPLSQSGLCNLCPARTRFSVHRNSSAPDNP